MNIPEIIYKHLIEYRWNYRKGLFNKFLLISIIFSTFWSYFYEDIIDTINNHPDHFLYLIFLFLFFFGMAFLIIIFIKPMNLLLSSTLRKSKLLYKQDIFNYLKEHIPEIEEMLIFQKISCSEILKSGLFKRKDYDIEGDDWMKGIYKNTPFMLSEINLFRYFKSIFYGQFVICEFNRSYPNTIISFSPEEAYQTHPLISNNSIKQIQEYSNKYNSKIKLSLKENRLYIAFWRRRNLFENKTKNNIENLESDYNSFLSSIAIVRSLLDDLI
jgi:hypothetical protein